MNQMSTRAHHVADEILFPAAAEVDTSGTIPDTHFATLAREGFYALAAPAELGGPALDLAESVRILEVLAGGCLTTTFTWLQHHSLVMALCATDRAELRERYLDAAVRGTVRAGIATAGAIPEHAKLVAEPVSGGFVLHGEAPFVSGWGLVDVLYLAARDGDTVVQGVVDACSGPHLCAEALDLVAAAGTNTVRLRFRDYFLPAEAVTGQRDYPAFLDGLAYGVRFNGALPLGLVDRCARLIEDTGRAEVAEEFRGRRDAVRERLDSGFAGDTPTLLAARAEAGDLALRCAAALVTATGSSAILGGQHAQRLLREAMFTLVAGSRPAIKDGLLDLLR